MILNLNLMPQAKKRELLVLTRINLIKNFFMDSFYLLAVFLIFLLKIASLKDSQAV